LDSGVQECRPLGRELVQKHLVTFGESYEAVCLAFKTFRRSATCHQEYDQSAKRNNSEESRAQEE